MDWSRGLRRISATESSFSPSRRHRSISSNDVPDGAQCTNRAIEVDVTDQQTVRAPGRESEQTDPRFGDWPRRRGDDADRVQREAPLDFNAAQAALLPDVRGNTCLVRYDGQLGRRPHDGHEVPAWPTRYRLVRAPNGDRVMPRMQTKRQDH